MSQPNSLAPGLQKEVESMRYLLGSETRAPLGGRKEDFPESVLIQHMPPECSFRPGPERLAALPGSSETLSLEAGSLFRAHRMTNDSKPKYKML